MEERHHARLILGAYEDVRLLLDERDRFEDADTLHFIFEQLTIDHARTLRVLAHRRPVVRAERVFVVAFSRGTTEAQNALLKLLEEPPEHARFYIIVPRDDVCIPTLRSRLQVFGRANSPESNTASKFLESTYAQRLAEIAERTKAKDRAWTEALLSGLEAWAAGGAVSSLPLKDIVLLRQYDRAPGASHKMLLEHLALSLPVIR